MSEIHATLEQVRTRLNEFIKASHPRPGDWVILSNIVDRDGSPYEAARDKLVMLLTNVRRETSIGTYNPNVPARAGSYAVTAPPLYIDLFVFLYANFAGSTYVEGLGILSDAISFFQRNPLFTRRNLPDLNPAIDKLAFEMTNLDTMELNHLVGMLGAHYLPSVYYKVRMIPFQSGAMIAEVPPVLRVNPGEMSDEREPAPGEA